MKPKASCLLVLSCFQRLTIASFHTDFTKVTRSADLLLEWDRVNVTDSPFTIHARVFNKTSENEVNTIEADIASEFEYSDDDLGLGAIDRNYYSGTIGELVPLERLTSPSPTSLDGYIPASNLTLMASGRSHTRAYYRVLASVCYRASRRR